MLTPERLVLTERLGRHWRRSLSPIAFLRVLDRNNSSEVSHDSVASSLDVEEVTTNSIQSIIDRDAIQMLLSSNSPRLASAAERAIKAERIRSEQAPGGRCLYFGANDEMCDVETVALQHYISKLNSKRGSDGGPLR